MIGLCHNCFSSNSDVGIVDGFVICDDCIRKAGNSIVVEHDGIKEKLEICSKCDLIDCRCGEVGYG